MRSLLVRSSAVFVLTLGLVGAGSWIPTQSRDEAATVSAVTRSWSELFAMLGNVDVVHGLFYSAMKVWLGLVGISPLTLRLPSVVACAAAAAFVVLIGSVLVFRRAGLLAGLVLAVSPRVTLIGTEGRSAAWFTAVAALLVLLVVLSVRRPSRWWLLPVALTTAVLGFLHIYTLLLAPVLLFYVLLAAPVRPSAGSRAHLVGLFREHRGWAALGIVLGTVPVVWLGLRARGQQAQVDWIDPPNLQTLSGVASETVSPHNELWAVLAWGCAVAGLIWLSRHRGRRVTRGATVLLVGWLVWPPLALIATSAAWSPLYSQRYMAFCVPALAVLAGIGLASIRRRLLAAVVALALPLAGLASYPAQRTIDSWDDWAQVMAVVRYRSIPGDAMVDYPLVSALPVSYPDAFPGVRVLNAGQDRLTRNALWDDRLPLEQVEPRLAGVQRLWYLTPVSDDVRRTAEIARLRQLGFRGEMLQRSSAEQTWLFTRTGAEAARGDRLLLRKPG